MQPYVPPGTYFPVLKNVSIHIFPYMLGYVGRNDARVKKRMTRVHIGFRENDFSFFNVLFLSNTTQSHSHKQTVI